MKGMYPDLHTYCTVRRPRFGPTGLQRYTPPGASLREAPYSVLSGPPKAACAAASLAIGTR